MTEVMKKVLSDMVDKAETYQSLGDGYGFIRTIGSLEVLLAQFGILVERKTLYKKGWFGMVKEYKEDYADTLINKVKEMLDNPVGYKNTEEVFEEKADKLQDRVDELEKGIRDWADIRMKDFTDNQYGKGDLKKLIG